MKAAHILLAGVVLALLLGGQPLTAEGWSLFGDSSKTETKTAPKAVKPLKPLKKEPSTLEKVVAVPKKLVTSVTDTVTGKNRAAAKKPTTQYTPWMNSKSVPEKKSGLASWFQPKEPDPPRSPAEWMTQKRMDY